jgi:hypothetical protein
MNTSLSSGGNSVVRIHDVHNITVSADSMITKEGRPLYWQDLDFFDDKGGLLGTVTLFLASPEAALPVGDQPPYWGVDPSKALMVIDGEAPF